MRIIANVKVGKARVKPTAPTHICGTREGNKLHALSRTHGLHRRKGGEMVKASMANAARVVTANSTSV